jgi:Zn-dependent protease
MLSNFIAIGPPLLIGIIAHEIAHGLAAERLGDPTARSQGRISLNPLVHIDPVMTLIMPGILMASGSPIVFGGAKPVPINPRFFRDPRVGMRLVALAGPVCNLLLAVTSLVLLHVLYWVSGKMFSLSSALFSKESGDAYAWFVVVSWSQVVEWLVMGYVVNIVLAVFNLLPIPPLDGGKILLTSVPVSVARRMLFLERWGLLVLFALLFSGWLDFWIDVPLRWAGLLLPS